MQEIAIFGIFCAFLITAALSDFAKLTVPNVLTAPFAAIGFGIIALGTPDTTLIALGAALVVFLLGWALFAFGVMGGGDGKLMAATAIWLDPYALLDFVVLISLFGGVLAAVILLLHRAERYQAFLGPTWLERLSAPRPPVPYALAIAPAGAVAFLRHSDILI